MHVKGIVASVLMSSVAMAGSAPTNPPQERKQERMQASSEVKELDHDIDDLLEQAKEVRLQRDRLEEQAEELETKDPQKSKEFADLAEAKHQELKALLVKLEELLKKRDFYEEELGVPEDQAGSPYQP